MAIDISAGQCDPALCNTPSTTPFITFNTNDYRVCRREISNSVPIKQLLKGTMAIPWVRLRFEGDNCPPQPYNTGCTEPGGRADPTWWDYTEITTGNISQPGCAGTNPKAPGCNDKCRAVIKSFHYAWGATQSGNVCKIVIHDESGSSFNAWFKRIMRNPFLQDNRNTAVNKMKVTFGWYVVGSDTPCPAAVDPNTTATCPASGGSPDGKLICSPVMWFVPLNLTCNMQNGKFVYELEGRDLLMTGQNVPLQNVFGDETSTGKTHFLDAVAKLGMVAKPPFNVQFAQLSEDGNNNTAQPLQFWKQPNTGTARIIIPGVGIQHKHYVDPGPVVGGLNLYKPVVGSAGSCLPGPGGALQPDGSCAAGPATEPDLVNRGPLLRYDCGNKDPIGAINHWMTEVRASTDNYKRDGKGLTFNYDPTFDVPADQIEPGMPTKGRLIVWGDAGIGSIRHNNSYQARKMATYIVNGGRCSPVFSFTPNIKWHWNALGVGGTMTPNTGETSNVGPLAGILLEAASRGKSILLNILGLASSVFTPAPTNTALGTGSGAVREAARSSQEHWLTNTPHDTIEAELRVQGDPSNWLCTPYLGTGRNVAIIVVNPFFLNAGYRVGQTDNKCPQFNQASGACHDILTNVNWWIKGAEHIIKEGSYITNIKVSLFFNPDIPAADPDCGCPLGISGDEVSSCGCPEYGLCEQGSQPCAAINPSGGEDVGPGAGSIDNNDPGLCATYVDNFNPCVGDFIVG